MIVAPPALGALERLDAGDVRQGEAAGIHPRGPVPAGMCIRPCQTAAASATWPPALGDPARAVTARSSAPRSRGPAPKVDRFHPDRWRRSATWAPALGDLVPTSTHVGRPPSWHQAAHEIRHPEIAVLLKSNLLIGYPLLGRVDAGAEPVVPFNGPSVPRRAGARSPAANVMYGHAVIDAVAARW